MNKVILYAIILSNIWFIGQSSGTNEGKKRGKEKLTEVKRDQKGNEVGYLYAAMTELHDIESPSTYEILSPPGAFEYQFTTEEDKKNLKNKWNELNWLTWKMLKKESKIVAKYRVSTFVKACKALRKIVKAGKMESGTAMRKRIGKLIADSNPASDEVAAFDCSIKVDQEIPTKLCGYSPIYQGLLFMVLLEDEFGLYHPMDTIHLRADISRLEEPKVIIEDENSMGYIKSMKIFDINQRLDISIWIQPLAFEYKFTNEKTRNILNNLWEKGDWFEWKDFHINDKLKTNRVDNTAFACEHMRSSLNAIQQESIWSIKNRVFRAIKFGKYEGFYRAIFDCPLQFKNGNEIATKLAGYPSRTIFNDHNELSRHFDEFFMVLLEHHEEKDFYMPMDVLHFDPKDYEAWSYELNSEYPEHENSQREMEIYEEERTYYEVLGVPANATENTIKKAYYKQAKLKHPDKKGNDPIATKEFQELQKAYATLISPADRSEYDRNFLMKAN